MDKETERTAFEAWRRRTTKALDSFRSIARNGFGDDAPYVDKTTNGLWAAWQARAALERPEHPVALKGRAAIVDAWNDLPRAYRQHPQLAKLWYAVGLCEDADKEQSELPRNMRPDFIAGYDAGVKDGKAIGQRAVSVGGNQPLTELFEDLRNIPDNDWHKHPVGSALTEADLPAHPDAHAWAWTESEKRAILAWGQSLAATPSAGSALTDAIEAELDSWIYASETNQSTVKIALNSLKKRLASQSYDEALSDVATQSLTDDDLAKAHRVMAQKRANEIEVLVAQGKMSAAECFTQMRQLVPHPSAVAQASVQSADFECVKLANRAASAKFNRYREVMLAAQPAPAAVSEPTDADVLVELNHRQWLSLENVRLLAARQRKEDWAQHMLRFCDEAGVSASPIRALAAQPAVAPMTADEHAVVRAAIWDSAEVVHPGVAPSDSAKPADCGICEGDPERCDIHDCGDAHRDSAKPAGERSLRQFEEWLDANRMKDVSEVFHDIVERFAAALAADSVKPAVEPIQGEKFVRAWLKLDKLPGTMMVGPEGKFGPIPASTSCWVTTSERERDRLIGNGEQMLEVWTVAPSDSSSTAGASAKPATPCAIRYVGGWNGHAPTSTWKCETCGYKGDHDAHPGCRRPKETALAAAPTPAKPAWETVTKTWWFKELREFWETDPGAITAAVNMALKHLAASPTPDSKVVCTYCGGRGFFDEGHGTYKDCEACPMPDSKGAAEPVAWSLIFEEDPRLNLSTVFDTQDEAESYVRKCGAATAVPLYLHPSSGAQAAGQEDARDAARYRKIRLGRSDYHGDCYAMSFQPDGDTPVDGEQLDRLVDGMRAALSAGKGEA